MFKLGKYHESVAKDIAKYLQDAGMKVDLRTSTGGRAEIFDYLEGRESELKGEIDETKFQSYERYLNALRAVLANGANSENFMDMFHVELVPDVKEKRKQFQDLIESEPSEDDQDLNAQNIATIMAELFEISLAEPFVNAVVLRNGIKIGGYVGNRLDDPVLRIPYDLEDYEGETPPGAKTTMVLTFQPQTEVYIDEFSATLAEELDEAFKDEYEEEFVKINYLAELLFNLMNSSSGKMDMETFSERCELQMEDNGDVLIVTGRNAAQNIARSLEKNGIIKVKGDSVKWKR